MIHRLSLCLLRTHIVRRTERHAGLGEADSAFAGGVGEEQFASFLRNEQALAMARSGGIGLAETLFDAMKRAEDA